MTGGGRRDGDQLARRNGFAEALEQDGPKLPPHLVFLDRFEPRDEHNRRRFFESLEDGGATQTRKAEVEKKDVDIGPVQIEHKQTSTVPIPPILSAIALVGGIGLVVVGAKTA